MIDDGHAPKPHGSEAVFGGSELRRRATGGALLLGARGALILVLGVGANILLARLLDPRDFGLVALGTVVVVFGGYLADGGLGAALIGRPETPGLRRLEAINGVQLAAAGGLAVVVAAAAAPFGRDGFVVAVMAATLPITVLRTPTVIVLERTLEYRVIATVDVIEAVAFYGWAVTTVALGMGVWGMATGMAVRALAGTGAMAILGPLGLVRPRWDWAAVRPFMGFGVKVQAANLVLLVRDQGMNIAVATIAGVATLGVWNLAWRVLQVPYVLFATVGRVAYPAMSRLLAADEDPRPVIERGLGTVCLASALLLVGIVGFAPALPTIVGDAWNDVPESLLWAALGLVIGAPTTVVTSGYLYAVDAVGATIRFVLLQAVAWFAVTLPLLDSVGAPAVGIGWVAGATLNLALISRTGRRRTGARYARSLAAPTALGVLGGAIGWSLAVAGDGTVLAGLAGAAVGELTLIGGLAVVRPSVLRETYALLRRSMRGPPAPEAAI
ncbi:MAG: hypothetical protein QOH76_88 [Thermoleophilaceae bacterium]|nr:hypothetical protein [Thermoleophilaceae bacterium]